MNVVQLEPVRHQQFQIDATRLDDLDETAHALFATQGRASLSTPKAKTVRGYSMFGMSFIYVIFEDDTDI